MKRWRVVVYYYARGAVRGRRILIRKRCYYERGETWFAAREAAAVRLRCDPADMRLVPA